MKNPTSS